MEATLITHDGILDRQQLALAPTPAGTLTHKVIPHHEVIEALVETLGFRHIGVVGERYTTDKTGMKMWGVLDLDMMSHDVRFSLGIRNSHDKSMRLAMTVGYRVAVCQNGMFAGDFQPVLAKHSKNLNLVHALSIGVDEMQRNFEPMVQEIDRWRDAQISDVSAKMVIYRAFVEGELEVPRHLDRRVHDLYFNPQYEEFQARTMWSLSNAFTSAFKEVDPIPQFKATASLATFLQRVV